MSLTVTGFLFVPCTAGLLHRVDFISVFLLILWNILKELDARDVIRITPYGDYPNENYDEFGVYLICFILRSIVCNDYLMLFLVCEQNVYCLSSKFSAHIFSLLLLLLKSDILKLRDAQFVGYNHHQIIILMTIILYIINIII